MSRETSHFPPRGLYMCVCVQCVVCIYFHLRAEKKVESLPHAAGPWRHAPSFGIIVTRGGHILNPRSLQCCMLAAAQEEDDPIILTTNIITSFQRNDDFKLLRARDLWVLDLVRGSGCDGNWITTIVDNYVNAVGLQSEGKLGEILQFLNRIFFKSAPWRPISLLLVRTPLRFLWTEVGFATQEYLCTMKLDIFAGLQGEPAIPTNDFPDFKVNVLLLEFASKDGNISARWWSIRPSEKRCKFSVVHKSET